MSRRRARPLTPPDAFAADQRADEDTARQWAQRREGLDAIVAALLSLVALAVWSLVVFLLVL